MTGEFTAAVHAIVFLNVTNQFMTSEAIAANVCTNPARIRKIMAKLKRAGLVSTREGSHGGGYRYIGNPDETTLCDILDAIGDSAVRSAWKTGRPDMKCLIASGMAEVMEGVSEQLEASCRTVLQSVTVSDVRTKVGIRLPANEN